MSKRKRQRGSAARAAPGPDQLRLEAGQRRPAAAGADTTAPAADAGSSAPAGEVGSATPAAHAADAAATARVEALAGDGLVRDAEPAAVAPSSADPDVSAGPLGTDGGPPPDPLGELLTPPSGDLPLVSAEAAGPPSGDFPTIASNAADAADAAEVPTPVRTRLRRFDTPVPRASTTPPIRPRPPPQVRQPPTPIELAPGTEITGDLLRQLREQRGITLKEIEEVTRVRATSLAAVEAERYVDLPDVKIYIRGFVQALARTIGVDAELAATSYLARWERTRDRTPGARRHFIK